MSFYLKNKTAKEPSSYEDKVYDLTDEKLVSDFVNADEKEDFVLTKSDKSEAKDLKVISINIEDKIKVSLFYDEGMLKRYGFENKEKLRPISELKNRIPAGQVERKLEGVLTFFKSYKPILAIINTSGPDKGKFYTDLLAMRVSFPAFVKYKAYYGEVTSRIGKWFSARLPHDKEQAKVYLLPIVPNIVAFLGLFFLYLGVSKSLVAVDVLAIILLVAAVAGLVYLLYAGRKRILTRKEFNAIVFFYAVSEAILILFYLLFGFALKSAFPYLGMGGWLALFLIYTVFSTLIFAIILKYKTERETVI
ncbi:MAG: hypothetical protein K5694_03490 [Bacilli bacterium]|nr:hypothetical protein [Bacilli bacterium]